MLLLLLLFSLSRATRVPTVFCVRCCVQGIDAAVRGLCCTRTRTHHKTALYCNLYFVFFWGNFYRKLSRMHAGVKLAFFFKPGGIFFYVFFERKHRI